MAAASYIPPKDADFRTFLNNFAALITATPAAYGLAAPDAVIIQAQADAFDGAYVTANSAETRTPAAIAAKDAIRAEAEATIRPYAQDIARSSAVSNELKVGLGLNLPNPTRPPIPPPVVAPQVLLDNATPGQHKLRYRDSSSPAGKAKPVGAIGVELYRTIGIAPAVDPDAANYLGTYTKSPLFAQSAPADKGKTATYFARFVTKSGAGGKAATGPWSAPLSVVII